MTAQPRPERRSLLCAGRGRIQEDDVNIPGYDAWRLSGPPEWEGPQCDYCGSGDDVRVESDVFEPFQTKPTLTCKDCFTGQDGGPCFDDLQTADDYAQEQADLRADYLHDQARDRIGEE